MVSGIGGGNWLLDWIKLDWNGFQLVGWKWVRFLKGLISRWNLSFANLISEHCYSLHRVLVCSFLVFWMSWWGHEVCHRKELWGDGWWGLIAFLSFFCRGFCYLLYLYGTVRLHFFVPASGLVCYVFCFFISALRAWVEVCGFGGFGLGLWIKRSGKGSRVELFDVCLERCATGGLTRGWWRWRDFLDRGAVVCWFWVKIKHWQFCVNWESIDTLIVAWSTSDSLEIVLYYYYGGGFVSVHTASFGREVPYRISPRRSWEHTQLKMFYYEIHSHHAKGNIPAATTHNIPLLEGI